MKVVELSDVKKNYALGSVTVNALQGVSFAIEQGEFIAIAGPSGSGKSTILNMIGCIDSPSSGRVSIDGREVDSLSDKELTRYRREKIGFIFQSFNLIPVLNVYENIEFPLLLKKNVPKKQRRETIRRFIERVGLSDRVHNKPHELSGGQRQRVAIARALVSGPRIILADEPTANLDTETGLNIISLMEEINAKDSTTFIFSTHDQHIMDRAHRVITLRDGQIAA